MCQNRFVNLVHQTFIIFMITALTAGGQPPGKVYYTHAANVSVNNLWCYHCDTMEDGDKCLEPAMANQTNLVKKCKDDKRICMVKRFSHTMTTENSTSVLKMWFLERVCTKNCEPGCIIIGERTKLFACTSCCEKSLCNTGKGSAVTFKTLSVNLWDMLIYSFFLFIF